MFQLTSRTNWDNSCWVEKGAVFSFLSCPKFVTSLWAWLWRVLSLIALTRAFYHFWNMYNKIAFPCMQNYFRPKNFRWEFSIKNLKMAKMFRPNWSISLPTSPQESTRKHIYWTYGQWNFHIDHIAPDAKKSWLQNFWKIRKCHVFDVYFGVNVTKPIAWQLSVKHLNSTGDP